MTEQSCSQIEEAMSILGRAWAGAVIQAMPNGADRFSDISRAVPGVTDGVLTTRLRELCRHGLVERTVEPGPPTSVRYRLTKAGCDRAPVLDAIRVFAGKHQKLLRG